MNDTWGDRVRTERRARGWSQSDLARRAGLARNTVATIERGHRGIDLSTARTIARCFALPTAILFPLDEDDDETADVMAS